MNHDAQSEAVLKICASVRKNGGVAYLVGGAVRDKLLGIVSKDADIEVFGIAPDALIDLLQRDFELDLVGASFGVVKIKGLDIDVAIPRRESKSGLGHRAFSVESDPFLSLSEAASRRDFTINAIYLDPLTGTVHDPFGGEKDLRSGILRHVSEKFAEDPLRVLRGMQFAARFKLSPAPDTVAICKGISREGLPKERIFAEWEKLILKGQYPSLGLKFLRRCGWTRFFPELSALIGCKQDSKWHPEGDVWNHTLLCLDAFAAERTGDDHEDLIVGLAVLCHDFGKPATTHFVRGRLRSLGHDEFGVTPTLSFLSSMTNEERILEEVPPLVKAHMAPLALWNNKAGDAAVRRLAARVFRIDRLIRVARADILGCRKPGTPPPPPHPSLQWLTDAAKRLDVSDSAPKPLVQGRDLIALGLSPSPQFGKILAQAYKAQIEGEFSDCPSALAWLAANI